MGELKELNALYREDRKHEDWRFALLICTLLNLHRDRKDKAVEPADIMPWLREEAPKARVRRQTAAQMRNMLEQVTRAMGGVVRRDHIPLDAGADGK